MQNPAEKSNAAKTGVIRFFIRLIRNESSKWFFFNEWSLFLIKPSLSLDLC
jgi:hypothetical protein